MSPSGTARTDRRLTAERRRLILEELDHTGRVLVSELARQFSVSEVTIRTDLRVLADEGLVHRTHGGAFQSRATLLDRTLAQKARLHSREKAAVAARAAAMVQEGMSVVLDSGSTTTEIARAIRDMNRLTVITNALNIALQLKDSQGIQVVVTGGIVRKASGSVVGDLAELVLGRLTADLFFLGVDGVDPGYGFATPNIAEADVNREMMRISRETVVVTDSSKFGSRSLAVICGPAEVDRIITNTSVGERFVKDFEALGVEMILV